ncbi:unnamed protein product [Clonostachys byssicola]|uniref:Uncharacterized protein n=1 Tax=Clonostachys byssicola TaxID=160290 RepID=A0A9N9Y1G1_9HYPO|nr:unnamed protein product [Clonostachys byssicola]
MPSEAEQRNLEQPWKCWYSKLQPMSRPDVRDRTLTFTDNENNNSGNQGTTGLGKRHVDLNAPKDKPVVKG